VELGATTDKNTTFETSLVPGLTAVTDAVPAVAMFAAGTVAVNFELDEKVVVRGVPFQLTVAPGTKPVPCTVRVNPALPGATVAGTSGGLTKGAGFWANAEGKPISK